MNNFKNEINYFIGRIDAMPDDITDIWPLLNAGEPLKEFKKYTGIDEYHILYLPSEDSEQARFRDLVWRGTWESLVDIDEAKCKKLKFLNSVSNLKFRYINALKFMDIHGPRSQYWSTSTNLPEDSYIA